jgi:hypothetical protein
MNTNRKSVSSLPHLINAEQIFKDIGLKGRQTFSLPGKLICLDPALILSTVKTRYSLSFSSYAVGTLQRRGWYSHREINL